MLRQVLQQDAALQHTWLQAGGAPRSAALLPLTSTMASGGVLNTGWPGAELLNMMWAM